jgi:hypothetical protein
MLAATNTNGFMRRSFATSDNFIAVEEQETRVVAETTH